MDGGRAVKKGVLSGVGVGPGDPQLLTLKAMRRIESCDVLAIPHRCAADCTAYGIACRAVPCAKDKPLLCIDLPMTHDRAARERAYETGADAICAALDAGKNVAFVTLGDPTVYSTFAYLSGRVERRGFSVEWIPGVPSFCAAAAELKEPLCTDRQALHIVPGGADAGDALALSGTKVFMKGALPTLLCALGEGGHAAKAVENCGMPEQRIYRGTDEIPADAGYYLVTIVKENQT